MIELQEPKTFKRPRLYWAPISESSEESGRMRIIYPSGRAEWSYSNGLGPKNDRDDVWASAICCWATKAVFNYIESCFEYKLKFSSGIEALAEMREYDIRHGYAPAEFLGEL